MIRTVPKATLCLVLPAWLGCSTIEERRAQHEAESVSAGETDDFLSRGQLDRSRLRTATQEEIDRLGLVRGEYALRVNRTLIYPCQYLRAEDLAATLQPLLQTQFGPGAFIVPSAETNHLFIYIPPAHERQGAARRATPPGVRSGSGRLSPTRSTGTRSTGTRSTGLRPSGG